MPVRIDVENPRWQCCCCCHVTTGACVIGAFELLSLAITLVTVVVNYLNTHSYNHSTALSELIGSSIAAALLLIAIILLFIGINNSKPAYLIMHMVLQILAIIGLFIRFILLIYLFVSSSAWILLLFSALVLLSALVEIWFFIIVLKAYQYLKLLEQDMYRNAYALHETAPPPYYSHGPKY